MTFSAAPFSRETSLNVLLFPSSSVTVILTVPVGTVPPSTGETVTEMVSS